jgi:phage tail protein X
MPYTGSLEKMIVMAYKDKKFRQKVGEFTVFINPASYAHAYEICYNNEQGQGSDAGSPIFNQTPSDIVSFQLVFDGTGVVPSKLPGVVPFTGDGIVKQIAAFRNLAFTYQGNIHSPNYLVLSWGTLLFRCRLKTLKITYTLFKPDGTPLRARADATFIGYNDEEEIALRANKSSPDLSHVLTVRAGDTLPLMCYGVYGTSAAYLQVARVNGLTDFRELRAGTQLLFPAVQNAAP